MVGQSSAMAGLCDRAGSMIMGRETRAIVALLWATEGGEATLRAVLARISSQCSVGHLGSRGGVSIPI
jgi:hypothetical protein